VRRLLKLALRACRLRCVDVRHEPPAPAPAPTAAEAAPATRPGREKGSQCPRT
jgi:hypothetical protein